MMMAYLFGQSNCLCTCLPHNSFVSLRFYGYGLIGGNGGGGFGFIGWMDEWMGRILRAVGGGGGGMYAIQSSLTHSHNRQYPCKVNNGNILFSRMIDFKGLLCGEDDYFSNLSARRQCTRYR